MQFLFAAGAAVVVLVVVVVVVVVVVIVGFVLNYIHNLLGVEINKSFIFYLVVLYIIHIIYI